MIEFDLKRLLVDKRLKTMELSEIIKAPLRTVQMAKVRGTVKVDFLRTLETHFGDCSKYIIKSDINHGKRVA